MSMAAPKWAFDFEGLAVSLKRYPDTKPFFSASSKVAPFGSASTYTDLFQNCAILDRQSIGTAVMCSDSKARCGDEKELRDFPPPGSFLLL